MTHIQVIIKRLNPFLEMAVLSIVIKSSLFLFCTSNCHLQLIMMIKGKRKVCGFEHRKFNAIIFVIALSNHELSK